MVGKINELVNAWVKWNMKEMSGDDFAYMFGNKFRKECLKRLNYTQKEKKILSGLLVKDGE